MRLLDLFCGAGGCSVGYHRAGFDVEGWDIAPHPDYPYRLTVGDAMTALADVDYLSSFDVVHASPPCPRFSTMTNADARERHPDLLTPTIAALRAWGGTWVVENVAGARAYMPSPVMYCGQAMGLRMLKRHRYFASSAPLMSPGCACGSHEVVGVYGNPGPYAYLRPDGGKRGINYRSAQHARDVMGIDWMTNQDDLTDAIPPAYTEHIGRQILDHLGAAA